MMRYSISDTAEYGDYEIGKRIITEDTKKEMKKVLSEIQDGTFASRWIAENKNGTVRLGMACRRIAAFLRELEEIGKELRKMYSWNNENKLPTFDSGRPNFLIKMGMTENRLPVSPACGLKRVGLCSAIVYDDSLFVSHIRKARAADGTGCALLQ